MPAPGTAADRAEPDRADELEGFLAALDIDRPDQALGLIPSGMGVLPPAVPGQPG